MKTDNPLKLSIDAVLKEAGFKRKAALWYRSQAEAVHVVELQKSNFGQQYYMNLGVFVKDPSNPTERIPKEHECHIRIRADALAGDSQSYFRDVIFDLENKSISDADRGAAVQKLLGQDVLPFLSRCATRAAIRQAHEQNLLSGALVHKLVLEIAAQ